MKKDEYKSSSLFNDISSMVTLSDFRPDFILRKQVVCTRCKLYLFQWQQTTEINSNSLEKKHKREKAGLLEQYKTIKNNRNV